MNNRNIVKLVDSLLLKLLNYPHIAKLFQRNMLLRNIGSNPNIIQPKALICYLTEPLYDTEFNSVEHPKNFQMLQLLNYFLKHGYVVDICNYVDEQSILKNNISYDVVVGQGASFNRALDVYSYRHSILFLTENNPEIVTRNYNERIEYFKQRHPSVDYRIAVARMGVFNETSLEKSNAIIAFNSTFSARSLNKYCKNVYPITVNTLKNKYASVNSEDIIKNKLNFVWLGSVGFIHKGLDILLDVFKELPDCTLNVYGVPKSEMSLWNKLKSTNTQLHPNIDVTSERFVDEVVKKNAFVISASCSEGIQTGVATCMRSGLIPIVTKDCGYDEHESIFILEYYQVDYVVNKLREIISLNDNDLQSKSNLAKEFSNSKYTNEQFSIELNFALDKILTTYE